MTYSQSRVTPIALALACLLGSCTSSTDAHSGTSTIVDASGSDGTVISTSPPPASSTDDSSDRIVVYSDRTLSHSLSELIAASDLVIRAQAGEATPFNENKNRNHLSWAQSVDAIEVILGPRPPEDLVIITFAELHPQNPEIIRTLEGGGEIYLPSSGFGALAEGNDYLLFLSYPNIDLGVTGTQMEVVGGSQGAIKVSSGEVAEGTMGLDSVARALTHKELGSAAQEQFHLDRDPRLLSSTTVEDATAEILRLESHFLPSGPPSDNFNISIKLATQGPFDPEGELVRLELTDGATNSEVYVALCQSAAASVNDCDTENAVLATVGSDGRASLELLVRGGPFADSSVSCRADECSIMVGTYVDIYSAIPIAFS